MIQRNSNQQAADESALAQPQLSQSDFASSQSMQLSSSFPPTQLPSSGAAPLLFPAQNAITSTASDDDADISSMSPRPTRLQTHSSWERNQIQTYAQMSLRPEASDVVAFMSAHSDTIRPSEDQAEQPNSQARELKRVVSFGTIVYHPEVDATGAAREADQQQRQQLPQLPSSLSSDSTSVNAAHMHQTADSDRQRRGQSDEPYQTAQLPQHSSLNRAHSLARLASPSPRPPQPPQPVSSASRTASAALAASRPGNAPAVTAAPITLPVSPRFVHGPSASTLSSQARIAPSADSDSRTAKAGASAMPPASARGGGGGIMRARVGLRYPLKSSVNSAAARHHTASTSRVASAPLAAANRRPQSAAARAPAPFFTPQKQVQPQSQPPLSASAMPTAPAPATFEAGVTAAADVSSLISHILKSPKGASLSTSGSSASADVAIARKAAALAVATLTRAMTTATTTPAAEDCMRRSELDERTATTDKRSTSPAASASAVPSSASPSTRPSSAAAAATLALAAAKSGSPSAASGGGPGGSSSPSVDVAAPCPRAACRRRTAALSASIAALNERAVNAERRASSLDSDVLAANTRIDAAQRGWDAWYAKALAIERRTMQRVEAEFERANRAESQLASHRTDAMLATDALAAERAHTAAAVAALNAMRRRCDDAESQLLVAREAAANSSPTTNRAARPVDSLDEDGGSRDADLDADESDMDADADESGAGGVMRLSHRIGNSARPTQLAVSAAAAAALPSEQRFVAATAASGADASASDASAATESTSASASAGELTALRGQVQSLLEQLSVARAQIRDGADANARVSQQWARDRDRADALWDKLQAATAEARAATAAAAEAKSTRERQQSDNSSDLVVEQQQLQLQLVQATQRAAHFEALHAALADEVRAAELRLRRLPGDLMFTEDGDEDTALLPLTASAGAIDGQGPEDGGGHGASSENAYRYHSTGDVAEHLLAPTEFSRPPSSVDDVATLTLSPFDFATTARLSTTAAASSALPSDSLYDPSAYSSMPLFVSSSSSEFASSSPTPLSSSSSQSALAALIGAAHANIQRRATRAAAAVHKARDEAIAAHTEGAAAVGLTDTYLEQLVRVQRELSASRRVGDRGGDDGGMARGSGGDDESW